MESGLTLCEKREGSETSPSTETILEGRLDLLTIMEGSDQDRKTRGTKRSKMETEAAGRRSKIAQVVNATELPAESAKAWIDCFVKVTPNHWKIMAKSLEIFIGYITASLPHSGKISVPDLAANLASALGLTEDILPSSAIEIERFLGEETAQAAFEAPYVSHGGEGAFWEHLEDQKKGYNEKPSEKYPFFSIIQSSGYGKSRLLHQLRTATGTDTTRKPRIIYLSFAATGAYPASNVQFQPIELKGRGVVEKAFTQLFEEARLSSEAASTAEPSFTVRVPDNADVGVRTVVQDDYLFVLDEVSQLLSKRADDEVDFFRCLRKATKTYVEYRPNSFFVLLSTYSSVNQLMPGRYFDPSSKVFSGSNSEVLEAMAPFLLHHAIAVRNDQRKILKQDITTVCHQSVKLLGMGRPLWHALLNTERSPKSNSEERASKLLKFALAKLLQQNPVPSQEKLTSQQLLALLACRACLTISPVSRFAPALVASHMGTAVSISTERDEVVVSYPSEPILALASRYYITTQNKDAFLRRTFVQLKEYFASGAVAKGHRGEVIVRLLNLLAMDACMSHVAPHAVAEVCLIEFLKQFDREGASLSEHLQASNRNVKLTDEQNRMLKREGILESAHPDGNDGGHGFYFDILTNGKVCFTHFIYLSDDAMITPDLLRYAYRRTAAVVVNARRRGIDWIIPVRVGDKDAFVGLAGQDKNRMRDTLTALSALSNETTHHKVNASYFLNPGEKQLFEKEGWSLNWPAILFSIGSEEVGAALADQAIRRRLRGDGGLDQTSFPCIVLTSLCYSKLMDNEANEALQQLRDFVSEPPPVYKEKVPLTFGVSNSTTPNDLPVAGDKMDCTE